MKGLKILLVVLVLGIASTAFAQVEIVPKLTYRPFFGMIDGTMSDLYSSYGAEVNAQFDLIKNSPWKMSAGLGYFGVFRSFDMDLFFVKQQWDIQIHYLYLPVNFLYEFKFGETFSLIPSLGFNARYGVAGPANVYNEFLYSPADNGLIKNDFFSETYNGAGNGQMAVQLDPEIAGNGSLRLGFQHRFHMRNLSSWILCGRISEHCNKLNRLDKQG